MTGLECLKSEMLARGFTKQQTESKTVLGVLEILSDSNGRYSDMSRIEQELKLLEQRKRNLWSTCKAYEDKVNACKSELQQIIQMVDSVADKHYQEARNYIDVFLKAISDCETQEARDALRTAQMFINSVSVDTKYDNTAFIIGLASILSQGKTGAIDELRKINPKIPKFVVKAEIGMKYGPGFPPKDYTIIEV